ncbi:MAG: fibronectin type III domain-containing protein, partial [Eubacterium sp.]|nr:fibronectin type III domain-containing protein [Eubacterium sp.]
IIFVIVMICSFTTINSNAASYPSVFFCSDSDFEDIIIKDTATVGDHVNIRMLWYCAFKNEGYNLVIRNSKDEIVATADDTFSNSSAFVRHITVGWNTKGLDSGDYVVEVTTLFYSYYDWREAPTKQCLPIHLKPAKSKAVSSKNVTLSKTSYVYNGKAQKPTVTVKDSKGKKIAASNYTVTYQSGRKNVGTYTVTIKFKGNYSGTVKKTFTIKPKATTLSSVSAKSKGFTAKWKKLTTQTTGYQIQYSTSSKFSSAKTLTVSKNSKTSKTISKLKAKKNYYVRVRTYKTVKVNGKSTKIYSSWSKAKSITTKK